MKRIRELNRLAFVAWGIWVVVFLAVMALGGAIVMKFFYLLVKYGVIFSYVETLFIVFGGIILINGGFWLLLHWDKYWREKGWRKYLK